MPASLGLDPVTGPRDGQHRAAVAEICAACATAGITGDSVTEVGRDFRMVAAGSDVGFLEAGVTAARARRDALTTSENDTEGVATA
ncbi:hypothetical protein [Pseudonocardia abyssalis]|uniref:Uncharacterized protein n=1 Tax=Pseudonocardia abyssalis TaxID=2792008 RepID=A0ABS6UNL4_9PSEU|nr:hypothetical protein [Pseudonocardia abyssalis]MBW0116294.1 hypothetical protein [Pseudonocardia abyssalis]MBW0133848.1 hypothetical protein [Pseudonocardia abyssalis]